LSEAEVQEAAEALFDAEKTRAWAVPVSTRYEGADVGDAYRIAAAVRDLKVADGRTVRGHKVGLTSKAMREVSGATEPDYGFLFDDWFIPEGSTVAMSRLHRPLVEAEIAFVMAGQLSGPSVNAADVIRATDFVLPMLEIVDSRVNARGKNGLVDATYSNGQTIAIYQIAVATFADPNGLNAHSDGMYTSTVDSGNATLHTSGVDGAGTIYGSELESSTTDTSGQFSNMISAQQAYSAASQVITTVNKMFDTLISAMR